MSRTIWSESGKIERKESWFDQDLKHKEFIKNNLKNLKMLVQKLQTKSRLLRMKLQ